MNNDELKDLISRSVKVSMEKQHDNLLKITNETTMALRADEPASTDELIAKAVAAGVDISCQTNVLLTAQLLNEVLSQFDLVKKSDDQTTD